VLGLDAGVETCGCVLGVNNGGRALPGGARLDISARVYLTMRGEKLDGRGVIPDVRAEATLADLRARRDVVLEAADQLLRDASSVRR
jgi:C-terminal processing protease CtpA/Prc